MSKKSALEERLIEGYKKLKQHQDRTRDDSKKVFRREPIARSDFLNRLDRERGAIKGKPAHYQSKIDKLSGISDFPVKENTISSILSSLSGQHDNLLDSQKKLLQKHFGDQLTPHLDWIDKNQAKQANRREGFFRDSIENTRKANAPYQAKNITHLHQALKGLQDVKSAKEELALDTWEKLGNHQTNLGNLAKDVHEKEFIKERNLPGIRNAYLKEKLDNISKQVKAHEAGGGEYNEAIHPDIDRNLNLDVRKLLRDHDIKIPSNTGNLLPEINKWLKESYKEGEALDTKFSDHDSTKGARRSILERFGLTKGSQDKPSNLESALNEQFGSKLNDLTDLRKKANRIFKKDSDKLAAKYIKLGQHNSPQHMNAALKRLKEINRESSSEMGSIITDGLDKKTRGKVLEDHYKVKNLPSLGRNSMAEARAAEKKISDSMHRGTKQYMSDKNILNRQSHETLQQYLNDLMPGVKAEQEPARDVSWDSSSLDTTSAPAGAVQAGQQDESPLGYYDDARFGHSEENQDLIRKKRVGLQERVDAARAATNKKGVFSKKHNEYIPRDTIDKVVKGMRGLMNKEPESGRGEERGRNLYREYKAYSDQLRELENKNAYEAQEQYEQEYNQRYGQLASEARSKYAQQQQPQQLQQQQQQPTYVDLQGNYQPALTQEQQLEQLKQQQQQQWG